MNLAVDRSENDPARSLTPARVTAGPTLAAPTAAHPAAADPFVIEADFNDVERLVVQGASLVVRRSVTPSLELKSITAYREVEHETHIDLDGTGYPIFGVLVDHDQDQFSQELQLAFAAGNALRGLIGAYWFSENDITPYGSSW